MLLASINLNKRLGADGARSRLVSWLRTQGVQVVLAQEPFKPTGRTPPVLPGFVFAGGSGHLATWISEDLAPPVVSSPQEWVQRIELDWLTTFQVHLDARAAGSRAAQLATLADMAAAESGRPLLICGDFNLAPRPEDGLFGDRISAYTTEAERGRLRCLLRTAALVDVTANDVPLFTFERFLSGKLSRFRCDLALLSDHLAPAVTVATNTAVRNGSECFTDHSALLIDLPVTLEPIEPAGILFTLRDLNDDVSSRSSAKDYQPHKTAMHRSVPSSASRAVTEYLIGPLGISSILDHGCGRGVDVAHYRSHSLTADGYDPHEAFDWPRPGRRDYDLVTSTFVLNVLPDPWQRIQALADAASFARPGGHVVVVTRSPQEIARAASSGDWKPHHDGFWSSEAKRTFQRGIDSREITALARHTGLVPVKDAPALPLPGACHVVLVKPVT